MSVEAIYIYVFERSRYALSENGIVFYAMAYCLEILVFEVEEYCSISADLFLMF